MRLLQLLFFLFLSQSLFSQVDTNTQIDTLSLLDTIYVIPDSLNIVEEEEPIFDEEFISVPDSIKVNDEDDMETALEKYAKQIERDSTNASAYFSRAKLLSGNEDLERYGQVKGDEEIYQKAKEDFDKAIELRPYNRTYVFERGNFHFSFLRYEKAKEDFTDVYSKDWNYERKTKALAQRSVANCKLGKIEPCLRDLETAISQDPLNITLLEAKSFSHMILKEHSLVIDYLNQILKIDPENKFAHANMAFTAISMGKYERAIEIYNDLLAKYDEDPFVIANIGYAKLKLKLYDEALEDINRSLDLFPNNTFALKNRALIYFYLGKKDEACKDMVRAKDLGYTTEFDDEVIKILFDKCLEINKKPK